jgi:plasmid stability protein
MKTITVRNLPPAVQKLVQDRARKKGFSANRAVLDLLLEQAEPRRRQEARHTTHDDLDELVGVWSKADRRRFDRAAAAQRTLDEELWK